MPDKIGRASLNSKEKTHGLYLKENQTCPINQSGQSRHLA